MVRNAEGLPVVLLCCHYRQYHMIVSICIVLHAIMCDSIVCTVVLQTTTCDGVTWQQASPQPSFFYQLTDFVVCVCVCVDVFS